MMVGPFSVSICQTTMINSSEAFCQSKAPERKIKSKRDYSSFSIVHLINQNNKLKLQTVESVEIQKATSA